MILNEIKKIQDSLNNNESNKIQSLYAMNYIYDDEFVSIINSLSSSIKDFFKSTRTSIGTIKKSSELILDEILGSKSSISDVFMQVDSLLLGKYTQNKANNTALSKEKHIKDKLNQIVEKLEGLNEIRTQMSKNTKQLELNCSKFYDEAKVIFKNMKNTRNQRLDELNNMNFFASGALTNLKNFHNQNNNINNQNTNNQNFGNNLNANNNNNPLGNINLNALNNNINNNNILNRKDQNLYNTDGFGKINFSPNRKNSGGNSNSNNNNLLSDEDNNNININNNMQIPKMSKSNFNFYSNNFSNLNCLKSQERIKEGPSKFIKNFFSNFLFYLI